MSGVLKLKGGVTLSGGIKKKKKQSNEKDLSPVAEEMKRNLEGYSLEGAQREDRRTEAEKKAEERRRKLEAERLKKLAGKSHKDKVREYNDHLAKLSEHHDIPKVSSRFLHAENMHGFAHIRKEDKGFACTQALTNVV